VPGQETSSLELEELPAGVTVAKRYAAYDLVECSHDPSLRTPSGMCSFCKADAHVSDGFRLPVKKLAKLTGRAAEAQGELF
jgi:hypothetical protein